MQRLTDPSQVVQSETVVVTDNSEEEDKQAETPLEDNDLRAIVTRQEKMVEHLCSQQAALTKVIATAILSPEQVATILQSERGGD